MDSPKQSLLKSWENEESSTLTHVLLSSMTQNKGILEWGLTDLCLFHRRDTTPISISINGVNLTSNKTINILGVIFDSKLTWVDHISHAIKRSITALNAIRIIKRFFTKKELLSLVTSNFYSILYYNSEIWQIPTLKTTLKQSLLSTSAKVKDNFW